MEICPGRPSGICFTLASVGQERGSTAVESLRSYHGRSNQPPLAPFSGDSAVQDGRAHVQSLHGSAPTYLSQLVRVADLPGRRCLCSARTSRLKVPSVRLSTVGGRAFSVSGPTIWNNLPDNVTSAPSLTTFPRHRKNFLFPISFPDIILDNS